MSKNTRWALAIVGVVIIIVAAFAIGSGKDDTKAETAPTEQLPVTPETTERTGPSAATGTTGQSQPDQGGGSDDNGAGGGDSGGASPGKSDDNSGGASPQNDTGGANADISVISPVLSAGTNKTIVVDKGQTIVIRGRSAEAGEMHLHGYDEEVALKPGTIARIKLKATIDGEFHIEFHLPSGESQVGILRVNP